MKPQLEPPPLAPDDPRHGTYNGYQNQRCRCQRCRDAHAANMRRYNQGDNRRRRLDRINANYRELRARGFAPDKARKYAQYGREKWPT